MMSVIIRILKDFGNYMMTTHWNDHKLLSNIVLLESDIPLVR